MNLELRSIIAPGDLKKERITLRALSNLEIGDYIVARTIFVNGSPSTYFDHAIWFPYKQVSKGDLVVLYTKNGADSEKKLSDGSIVHFFYFDLDETIWDNSRYGAIVLNTPSWESESAEKLANLSSPKR